MIGVRIGTDQNGVRTGSDKGSMKEAMELIGNLQQRVGCLERVKEERKSRRAARCSPSPVHGHRFKKKALMKFGGGCQGHSTPCAPRP